MAKKTILIRLVSLLISCRDVYYNAHGLSIHSSNIHKISSSRSSVTSVALSSSNDDDSATDDEFAASSTFEKDVPSGLRGEAVRASIRSKNRGVWFKPIKELECSMIHIEGRGTLDFIQSKLSSTFREKEGSESCFLTSKGKVFDKVTVIVESSEDAYLITSPFSGNVLFDKLNDLIFPMDEVRISDCTSAAHVFCVASTTYANAQSVLNRHLTSSCLPQPIQFPPEHDGGSNIAAIGPKATIVQGGIGFPACALQGYTIFTFDSDIADSVLTALSLRHPSDGNSELPLLLKKREYDTLRIEAAVPSFGNEFTAHLPPADQPFSSAAPLELLLDHAVDLDKGCYLGQEQVSSMLKNVRGPPRSLYSIVFYENSNDHATPLQPSNVGDAIYVLGSNQTIKAGFITSVAEPGATGKPYTLALALLSRPQSIIDKMAKQDLNIEYHEEKDQQYDPQHLLNGLDVIIHDSYHVGVVQSVPFQRFPSGTNMFDPSILPTDVMDVPFEKSTTVPSEKEDDQNSMEDAIRKAKEEEKVASAEAKRKADKLALLQQRAQAAILARKMKKK